MPGGRKHGRRDDGTAYLGWQASQTPQRTKVAERLRPAGVPGAPNGVAGALDGVDGAAICRVTTCAVLSKAAFTGMRQDFEVRKRLNSKLFPSRAGHRHRMQMA